jgi:RING finger protein 113A
LHDRGTCTLLLIHHSIDFLTKSYLDLAGWQLDKLAENPQKQVGDDSGSDSDDEDIPFACLICRKHYTDPIVTRCGHYFCTACAIKRNAKTPKCAACGATTGGLFNRADKVIEKVNKKRKEKEDAEAMENGHNEGGEVKIEGLQEDSEGQEDED